MEAVEAIREEMLEFSDLVRNAGKEMRLFPQNQYEAALDWLKSDLATDKQE